MFSVFLHGKGGKGVATWVGAFVAISTSGTILCALGFLAALYFYNFVSLASLVMVALMPVVLLFQGLYGAIPLALVLMALIFWKHSENIQRLMAGEEHPWKIK
jgi:glycerol-3-phosphate acyltransferase PlsY